MNNIRPLALAAIVGALIAGPATTAEAQINKYAVTQDEYQIVFSESSGASFTLASGVSMNDPDYPFPAPLIAFNLDSIQRAVPEGSPDPEQPVPVKSLETVTAQFIQNTTVEEEARTLHVYFKAQYGLSDAKAAYDYAYRRKDTEKSIVCIIELTGVGPSVRVTSLQWITEPRAQRVADAEVLRQFVDDYGSHYIQATTYGFRIAIRGTTTTKVEKEFQSFSAAFKGSFGGLGAKAGGNATWKKTLEKANVTLMGVVTAGKVVRVADGGPQEGYPSVLTSYDQIVDFIEGVRKGTIAIYPGVTEARVRSFWHTVPDYPKVRAALSPPQPFIVDANFGVPRGAIIPWSPAKDQVYADPDTAENKYQVPDGWALCDGTNGTPDLRDRFVLGSERADTVGQLGGSATHTHTAKNTGSRFEAKNVGKHGTGARRFDKDKIVVDSVTELPPFVRLVYIMKR